MANSPKVQVRIPSVMSTTERERAGLKRAFNTKMVRELRDHGSVGTDITNVDPTVIEIIVVNGVRSRKGGAKAGKKASKKKTASKK